VSLWYAGGEHTGGGLEAENTLCHLTQRPPEQEHSVSLQSTSVVSGSGKGVVVATGAATYIASLARALPSGRTMTAFDFAVRRVVYLFIAFIVIMVPLVIVLSGKTTSESPHSSPTLLRVIGFRN
jgi:magnesium-transporting ATPase (P-type)